MGIRLALGSSRSRLYRLVFTHAFRLTPLGLLLGTGVAALGTGWLESLLFSTSPADSTAWGTMAGSCSCRRCSRVPCPAWRAASTDPVSALRE
jgi:putative ABC transport system permease protein